MSRILHRIIGPDLPHAVHAQGVWITDSAGRRYLDGSGGAAVSSLGHGNPEVLEAMRRQMEAVAYAHTSFFTTDAAESLAERLVALAPDGLDYVYPVSGGSEAVEAALKMARQYFVETGQPQRRHIIARRQSYHGNTIGALATGGNEWRRAQFRPILPETHHVAPCYAYRDMHDDETPAAYGQRLADELDATIRALGSDQVIAFVAEPVVGATLGAVAAVPGYFAAIREVCDRHGVLLILDEVMCGMGRTGTIFACEQEGVVPDILTIAKGLGGGYQPVGAVMLSARIRDAFADGSGLFQHGHTYLGHPVAMAAADKVVEIMSRPGLMAHVADMGARLDGALRDLLGDHPNIGDIRGRGLFRGVELVADRAQKTPLDADLKTHARIKRAAMARGLACYPMGGTIDGRRGDHILLAPPYIISAAETDELATRLAAAIRDVLPG
ncbi:MAG: aspartate aminotransferase family protein [Paracoccus sp. (in: a-proteobacteria)]|nr:aspartate aminotransferase family protein [Paracoccus sp. (in: a-proteobacteria)]